MNHHFPVLRNIGLLLLLLPATALQAQRQGVATATTAQPLPLTVEHARDFVTITLDIPLEQYKVKSNEALLLTPAVSKWKKFSALPSVAVYGRRRRTQMDRTKEKNLSDEREIQFRAGHTPAVYRYKTSIPHEYWTDSAEVMLLSTRYACCEQMKSAGKLVLLDMIPPISRPRPLMAYVTPRAESVKTRQARGEARVTFPVNKTDIRPAYMSNAAELGKIERGLDSLRLDSDLTVTALALHGAASPEGPYANNERLAAARTEALRRYAERRAALPRGAVTATSEAENWSGLILWLQASALEHKADILALAQDGSLQPDEKERRIRDRYPQEWAAILREACPALRRTTYEITYTVRQYASIQEIRQAFHQEPGKLSLQELYLLAADEKQGSDAWAEVYITAARLYPSDPVANLNAAFCLMERGSLVSARTYLQKAGVSAEAIYAEGVYAYLKGDDTAAAPLLREAARRNVPQAGKLLQDSGLGDSSF